MASRTMTFNGKALDQTASTRPSKAGGAGTGVEIHSIGAAAPADADCGTARKGSAANASPSIVLRAFMTSVSLHSLMCHMGS
ncbi:MAG: hypothetical protein IPM70_07635 [Proteobacteria bacterium]|nr:hypothetical protein [Pseudomonadota bacterium]